MSAQTAAVLLIGEELLTGKIDDVNGSYAIAQLRNAGVQLRELRWIGDDVPTIAQVVRALSKSWDIVITSGGVGPTHDDLTMRGIAKAFDVPIHTHAQMLDIIQNRFGASGEEARVWERMAELPQGCGVVVSDATRVPIFRMHNVWALPGIPELFRLQLDQIVRGIDGNPVRIRTMFLSVGEGEIAGHLEAALAENPGIKIGSYPILHAEDHITRVTIEHADGDQVERTLAFLLQRFPKAWVVRIGDHHRINEPPR